jgi:hypothetical protein
MMEDTVLKQIFILCGVNLSILFLGSILFYFYYNIDYVHMGIFGFLLYIETCCMLFFIIRRAINHDKMIENAEKIAKEI